MVLSDNRGLIHLDLLQLLLASACQTISTSSGFAALPRPMVTGSSDCER